MSSTYTVAQKQTAFGTKANFQSFKDKQFQFHLKTLLHQFYKNNTKRATNKQFSDMKTRAKKALTNDIHKVIEQHIVRQRVDLILRSPSNKTKRTYASLFNTAQPGTPPVGTAAPQPQTEALAKQLAEIRTQLGTLTEQNKALAITNEKLLKENQQLHNQLNTIVEETRLHQDKILAELRDDNDQLAKLNSTLLREQEAVLKSTSSTSDVPADSKSVKIATVQKSLNAQKLLARNQATAFKNSLGNVSETLTRPGDSIVRLPKSMAPFGTPVPDFDFLNSSCWTLSSTLEPTSTTSAGKKIFDFSKLPVF